MSQPDGYGHPTHLFRFTEHTDNVTDISAESTHSLSGSLAYPREGRTSQPEAHASRWETHASRWRHTLLAGKNTLLAGKHMYRLGSPVLHRPALTYFHIRRFIQNGRPEHPTLILIQEYFWRRVVRHVKSGALNHPRHISVKIQTLPDKQQITRQNCAGEIGDSDLMAAYTTPDI